MSELKRCPFCGGEAKTEEHFKQWDGRYYEVTHISCRLCGCSSNTISEMECKDRKKRKEEAIAAWNARRPVERILERLEEEDMNLFKAINKYQKKMYTDREALDMCRILQHKQLSIHEAVEIVKEEGGLNA